MRWPFDTGWRHQRCGHKANGFTLIELLVVLAIFGLLLAIIPQATAGLPRFQLHAASGRLADILRQLRDDAVRTGRTTNLRLDGEHLRYAATGAAGWQALPGVVQAIRLSRDTPVPAPADPTLRFFADGGSNGGIITLLHGSQTSVVTVEWLTGRVRND